jgi:hypothetical protein
MDRASGGEWKTRDILSVCMCCADKVDGERRRQLKHVRLTATCAGGSVREHWPLLT